MASHKASQMRRFERVRSYEDARKAARKVLPKSIFEYVDGGAEDEITLRRNVDEFRDVELRPQSGVWVPKVDLRTSVLGEEISMPVISAPCGGMRLIHPEGDKGVAHGVAQSDTIFTATSASGFTLEEIASVPGRKWFQLYRFSNRHAMEDLTLRAQAAGYSALVATIDTSVAGNRERDYRNGFSYDMRINLGSAARLGPQVARRPLWLYRYVKDGMPFELPNTAQLARDGKPLLLSEMTRPGAESHSPSWEDIGWLRENWRGPLIVKGILTALDARRAADSGADAVVVSNHGGRQLDGAPPSLGALPEVLDKVGDSVEVLLDSGIRRGSDVVKAVSLGATAVLVGRMPVWGLAVGGSTGVSHVLEILRTEMIRTMQLMGCPSVASLDETWVQRSRERRLSSVENGG